MLPLEALDEMEKAFRIGHSKAIKKSSNQCVSRKNEKTINVSFWGVLHIEGRSFNCDVAIERKCYENIR